MLDRMRNSIKRVFWLYFVLFLAAIVYLVAYVAVKSPSIVTNTGNPRMRIATHNPSVRKGDIVDHNGTVLVTTDASGARDYLDQDLFCHVIGFERNGVFDTKCIESEYFFTLQQVHNEIYQRVRNIFDNTKPVQGNSVVLTLDKGIQTLAYDCLKDTGLKGSIVVLEPSTGKVLAMVSSPAYTLADIPDILSTERQQAGDAIQDSPFLNRATQGLYPPGSVFKIITAAAAIQNMGNWKEFTYDCTGSDVIGGVKIRCFNEKAHGKVDMYKAMAVSCNGYFAKLGETLGGGKMRAVAETFYCNNADYYAFPLAKAESEFLKGMNQNTEHEKIIKAAIGQGDTLVTPLHMAMIFSSVANSGIMMTPYIVDHGLTNGGAIQHKYMPKMIGQVCTPEVAYELKNMMVEVVNTGTGVRAKINDVSVAGKTGTAQITATDTVSGDKALRDHAWFVGFAPADNPTVTVAVMLENGGNGSEAAPIAKKIIKFVLDQK